MRPFLIFAISVIVALPYSCKTEEIILHGEISGYVTDEATTQPLLAAKIKLNPTLDSTKTGIDGKYLIKSLTPGDYEVVVSKFSYATSKKNVRVASAEIQEIDFALKGIPLPHVSDTLLDFGSTLTSLKFSISRIGAGKITYALNPSQDWINMNPSSGEVADETDTITVTLNRTGLLENTYL
jgi:hypothetical protein